MFLSFRLISYCNNTRDFMVPSVWGQVCDRDPRGAHTRALTLHSGRPEGGPLRPSADERLLHRHVMAS